MTVKNIEQFHGHTKEELGRLSTEHLIHILESTRGRKICSCGKGHHCGDDVLDEHDQMWNDRQDNLQTAVREVLASRPNVPRTKQAPKREKKVLKY